MGPKPMIAWTWARTNPRAVRVASGDHSRSAPTIVGRVEQHRRALGGQSSAGERGVRRAAPASVGRGEQRRAVAARVGQCGSAGERGAGRAARGARVEERWVAAALVGQSSGSARGSVHQRRRSWGGQSSAGDRGVRRAAPGNGDLRGTGQRRFAWDRGAPAIVGQSSTRFDLFLNFFIYMHVLDVFLNFVEFTLILGLSARFILLSK